MSDPLGELDGLLGRLRWLRADLAEALARGDEERAGELTREVHRVAGWAWTGVDPSGARERTLRILDALFFEALVPERDVDAGAHVIGQARLLHPELATALERERGALVRAVEAWRRGRGRARGLPSGEGGKWEETAALMTSLGLGLGTSPENLRRLWAERASALAEGLERELSEAHASGDEGRARELAALVRALRPGNRRGA